MYLLLLLVIIITLLIIAGTKFKIHPFLTLILAAITMGFCAGLDSSMIINKITGGFGDTIKSIGIIIAFGTIIGSYLERSGGAEEMASSILKLVGDKKAPLAMNITGFIVSIPVFCDSGFVILSTLNKALSKKTNISLITLAIALSAGLYTTHVFVPPTPGPLAAAATIGADVGLVLLLGLVVAIPTASVGLLWSIIYGKNKNIDFNLDQNKKTSQLKSKYNKNVSFATILVPIVLIALKSISELPSNPFGEELIYSVFTFIGDPVIALLIGVSIAFSLMPSDTDDSHFDWVLAGLKNAGVIILITGAGGAFGNVLRATEIKQTIAQFASQTSVGIFLPFLIAAILKSAQGSSTVSIITTSAIVSPILVPLGLGSVAGKALSVLAIGAGAMTVSHVNDSYFWVVAQFSEMSTKTALKGHTVATLLQGGVGIIVIFILSIVLL